MIYELIAVERGHFYVCGDCKMAENVYQTLKSIIQEQTGMNSTQSDNFMLGLRVSVQHVRFMAGRPRKFADICFYFYTFVIRFKTITMRKFFIDIYFMFFVTLSPGSRYYLMHIAAPPRTTTVGGNKRTTTL